jgi:hypothetical protein
MKRKTDFKQMFLVDDTLYNKISNVTPQLPSSMIVGKLPAHSPSQAPNFHPITNISNITKEVLGYATPTQGKIMKSSAMMTEEIPHTAPTQPKTSSGMMTEDMPPTTIEVPSQQGQINALQEQLHTSQLQVRALEASLHTPQLVDHTTQYHALPDYTPPPRIVRHANRVLRNVNRTPRMEDRTLRMEDRTPRMEDRTPRIEDRTLRMEDRTPRMEDRTLQLDYRTPQLQFRTPQPGALQMQYPNMIQNIPLQHQVNSQQLAIPQASGPLTSYSYPMDTSPAPEQLELMDFNTNKPIEYQSSAQPMDLSETALFPKAPMATRALAPPVKDECEDCAEDYTVTKYVKYNEPGIVALPSVLGLPNNVLFTCTLCNTNFKTQKTLQRHMKNQHDAFDQQEKGAKRKRVVSNTNNADANTMKKSKTDKNLRNKAVVSYTKYL